LLVATGYRILLADIAGLLAVSERSVQSWTKDVRKAEREQLQAKAWDLWLDCNSQTGIAEAIGVTQQAVSQWLQENAKLREFVDPPESRQHFDIWQFSTSDKDAGQQS
jgi:DNA-binding transcriptional regulator YdaS (Cro superfamily)